jgi:hypothetical protein
VLDGRIFESGGNWEVFWREALDLPEIPWPRVWEKVFDDISQECADEERAERERLRQRGHLTGVHLGFARAKYRARDSAYLAANASYQMQKRDDLAASYEREKQCVEDYQDESRRLQQDHAQIIRPDKRLWFGVAVLVIFTAVGVAWPIFLMSQGPTDLAQVRLAVWPLMVARHGGAAGSHGPRLAGSCGRGSGGGL